MTLTPPGMVSIAVSPVNPPLPVGEPRRFTATGTFNDGSTQVLGSAIWRTADSTIATISNDVSNLGTAYGVSAGQTTVNACPGALCGSPTQTLAPATFHPHPLPPPHPPPPLTTT